MRPGVVDEYHDEGEVVAPQVLEASRQSLLQAVIRFAANHLPFYQDLWSGSVDFDAVTSPEGFRRLPMVRKRDLINAMRKRSSSDIGLEDPNGARPATLVLTSGTGGFHTFAALTNDNLTGPGLLAQLRELWAMRIRPGMRVLSVSPAWHALGNFETRALTELGAVAVMPWGTLTPRFIGQMLDAIDHLHPEHLLLTARSARMLLAECNRRGLEPLQAFSSVKYLGCAGEALSPAFRNHLEEAFGLDDLFERGGSGDGMFGGSECHAHRGHHISAEVHYVEVVSPEGLALEPGERGVAVVTNLASGRSVYVRFNTEDVAAIQPGPCPCGRTQPVIEFYGRLDDSVVVGSRLITPADVRMVLDELEPTRFRAFSMTGTGELIRIALAGLDTLPRAEVADAERLVGELVDAEVKLEPAGLAEATWKQQQVTRPGVGQ